MTAPADVRVVATGLEFPEGPIAMPDGSVIVVEIKRGTLSRVGADGSIDVIGECGGGPNGAAIGPDGRVYVCNNGGFEWQQVMGTWNIPGHQPEGYIGGRIQRVDIETGVVEDLYTECDGHPLLGPNDLVFDADGGFWFTDHGKTRPRDRDWGGIYYAKADGSSIREVVHPSDAPNGIGLSPDGTVVYWAETHTGRVYRRKIVEPGVIEQPTPLDPWALLAGLPGGHLFDSLAVDGDGNVCVATLGAAPGISVISPDGDWELVRFDGDLFDPLTTNICFGGDDLTTAYVTLSASGRLLSCRWPRPGLRLTYG
jgi:gluconolactonase